MPHAGLLRLAAARSALPVDELGEADVGDAGSLFSDQMHVRVQDGGVDGLTILRQHCKRTHTLILGFIVFGSHTKNSLSCDSGHFHLYTPTVLKVKSVEVHALHQVPQSFGFKGGQPRVTDFPETNEIHFICSSSVNCSLVCYSEKQNVTHA